MRGRVPAPPLVDFAWFNRCHWLNAVHIGDSISRHGFCSRRNALAVSLLGSVLKSQGNPSSGSLVVRSNANPSARCLVCFDRLALISRRSWVILGGEYISDTVASLGVAWYVGLGGLRRLRFVE